MSAVGVSHRRATTAPVSSNRTYTVRDLPLDERPRERLQRWGAATLSPQELLACVLGRGIAGESVLVSAQRLLSTFGNLTGIRDASVEELACVHGIGPAKAAQLKAALELSRRVEQAPPADGVTIADWRDVVRLLEPRLAHATKEHFVAVLLDARHRVLRVADISVGSLTASIVHPRELFHEAITAHAAALIVAHNHPSGDPAPSEEDVLLTRRLVAAGRVLGIEVLDHVILGAGRACSLQADGLLTQEREETT